MNVHPIDELNILNRAMGGAVDDFLASHLPEGAMKDYVRLAMAKRHAPKAIPAEESVQLATPQRALPSPEAATRPGRNAAQPPLTIASSTSSTFSTPDAGPRTDPMERARQHVIAACQSHTGPDIAFLAEMTGYSRSDIQRFIESTLANYLQKKHIDPILGPTAASEKSRSPASEEGKARRIAGIRAYHLRRAHEKAALAESRGP